MKPSLLAVVCLFPSFAFAAVPETSIDIGGVGIAGSTTMASGVYTVRASGSDVWDTADEFRFAYAALNGDGEVTARVDSLVAWENWAKAGVMIRETLSPSSRYAFAILSSGHGVSFQYRSTAATPAAQSGTADEVTRAPHWIRLRRAGNVFTAYASADGQTWRQHGDSITIAMGASVYAGLALSSHSNWSLTTAAFSNVAIGGSTPPPVTPPSPPPPTSGSPSLTTSLDIGGVGIAGSTTIASGVYTVQASGSDVWEAQDEFRFVHGALNGNGEITARVDNLTAWENWAKAGVMIRETLSPSSRYAFAILSAGHGVSFHYRSTAGTAAAQSGTADEVTRAPHWIRLRRAGNVFTAFASADGQTWRQQGSSITIAMGASAYVGLALSSHLNAALATATFSNVSVAGAGVTPVPTNTPPTISGTPPTTATVGTQYSFTPTAADPDGNALTYSIANRPSWATFDTSTGRLAGTPTSSHVGNYAGIVISVSDGLSSAAMPAFQIAVSGSAGTGNRAPVISGTPAASVVQGTAYTFQPTATDPDGDALTFSIQNAPSWTTFNAATGRLQGTPTASSVGVFSNIVIRVSDGRTTTSLTAFSITVLAFGTGSATLSWTPPTRNTDGSTLTNLAGYRIYWGSAAGNYTNSTTVNTAGLTSYVVENLAPGTYYFAVSALSSSGVESALSNAATKTIR
jgi:hypothetical protein